MSWLFFFLTDVLGSLQYNVRGEYKLTGEGVAVACPAKKNLQINAKGYPYIYLVPKKRKSRPKVPYESTPLQIEKKKEFGGPPLVPGLLKNFNCILCDP